MISKYTNYAFNQELYDAFVTNLEKVFGIIARDEINGGLSGARTSSVLINGSGKIRIRMGRYILKVSLIEDARLEKEKHEMAKGSSILHRHVPELVASWSDPDMGLTGILYQIAGYGELTSTTFQNNLDQNAFQRTRIDNLAKAVLRWNFESHPLVRTMDLLGCIRDGLRMDFVESLKTRLGEIVEHIDQPRIDLHWLENTTYYNPMYFLLKPGVCPSLEHIRYSIPCGMLHRDLHPGNVIIPTPDQAGGTFHLIDFGTSRPGNAFFDLAYLEITLLFNSFNGFHSIVDLKNWWQLEKYLITRPLPILARFGGEGLGRVLPIRRALANRIKHDGAHDDYWIAYLAASVEAGLELARKLRREPYRQRMAFLTAVSRFHHLVELLKIADVELQQALETSSGALAIIHRPGEEAPASTRSDAEERTSVDLPANFAPALLQKRAKFELVWPGEINRRTALFDPWMIVEGTYNSLTGDNDQGVLLLGERKFGKTSFFNCVANLFPRNEGIFKTIRVDTLNVHHSVQSFAGQLLTRMHHRAGLPMPPEVEGHEFDVETFFSACEAVVEEKPDLRFVIFVDELDSALINAVSQEEAATILQLLERLLTDPYLPIRLLFTASNTDILRSYQGGVDFVDNVGIRKIPLCSAQEMEDLIQRFDMPVPLTFEPEALSCIFAYSGGQIYLVKLVVSACLAQASGIGGTKRITDRLVDDLMHAVIEPHSSSFSEASNFHETVFPTMRNIYERHFSDQEQQFMRLLTEVGGVLQASSVQVSQEHLTQVANTLYRRGYIDKIRVGEEDEFTWRIGTWRLFIENRFQLNHHNSQQ